MLNEGTAQLLDQMLSALPPEVKPDAISLHAYPFDDRAPYQDSTALVQLTDSLLTAVERVLTQHGLDIPIQITEFGNINAGLDEAAVLTQTKALITGFAGHKRVERWYWYKATGYDTQFQFLTGAAIPLTRLAKDIAFSPTDGDFSCEALNSIGEHFYKWTHGKSCQNDAPAKVPKTEEVEQPVILLGLKMRRETNYCFNRFTGKRFRRNNPFQKDVISHPKTAAEENSPEVFFRDTLGRRLAPRRR